MSLFEIPGWSLSSDPVTEPRDHGSKKRKRSSGNRPESMEVNLEKLVKRLKRSSESKEDRNHNRKQIEDAGSSIGRNQTKGKKKKSKTDDVEERKKTISLPKPLKATIMDDIVMVPPRRKILKESRPIAEVPPPKNVSPAGNVDVPGTSGLTSLQKEMKHSLDGARFRHV